MLNINENDLLPKANHLDRPRKVSISDSIAWLSNSWSLVKPDLKVWALILLALFIATLVLGFIPFMGAAIVSICAPIVFGGLLLGVHYSATSNIRLKFQNIWMGFDNKWLSLIIIGVIGLLVSLISGWIADYIGAHYLGLNLTGEIELQDIALYLLFGVISLFINILFSIAFFFAIPLIMFNDISAIAALKASIKGGLTNILPLLVYSILATLLVFLGALPMLLGLFIVIPMLEVSVYLAYKDVYVQTI